MGAGQLEPNSTEMSPASLCSDLVGSQEETSFGLQAEQRIGFPLIKEVCPGHPSPGFHGVPRDLQSELPLGCSPLSSCSTPPEELKQGFQTIGNIQ